MKIPTPDQIDELYDFYEKFYREWKIQEVPYFNRTRYFLEHYPEFVRGVDDPLEAHDAMRYEFTDKEEATRKRNETFFERLITKWEEMRENGLDVEEGENHD